MNNLRRLRMARNLTQEAAAEAIGTTRNQYVKLETGMRRLSLPWIDRIASAYGIDPGEVVTNMESPRMTTPTTPRADRINLPGGMYFDPEPAFDDSYALNGPNGALLGPQWWHGKDARAFAAIRAAAEALPDPDPRDAEIERPDVSPVAVHPAYRGNERYRMDEWTPAELAISDAMLEVERTGASLHLTNAIQLLAQARQAVARHVIEAAPPTQEPR